MADVVVVGGGPNGLAVAGLLARAGRRVVLVERRAELGGLAAPEEFHPGYRTAGVLQDTSQVSRLVVEALELGRHGLELLPRRPEVLVAAEDGPGLLLGPDVHATAAELGRHGPVDAAALPRFRDFLRRVGPVLDAVLGEAPPRTVDPTLAALLDLGKKAVALRRLGKRDMLELLRVAPMCAGDLVREWFPSGPVQGALAVPGIASTWLGPWSAGSALNLLAHEHRARVEVRGGPAALVAALEAALRAAHVELRTGAAVDEVLVEGGCALGVRLESGEEVRAATVVATCDPKSLFECLVPAAAVPEALAHRIAHFRARGTTSVLRVALDAPLAYACRPDRPFELARTGGELDELERAFDPVKYRALPQRPILEVHQSTVSRPGDAPAGHAVLSVLVHFTPHDLEGGWTEARRAELTETVLDRLEALAPGTRGSVVATDLLAPPDLAARFGTTGGHLHHGEHALDQFLLRPTPETSRYATPIAGLFLGGSGSHPGGGLTLEPARLCAEALAD